MLFSTSFLAGTVTAPFLDHTFKLIKTQSFFLFTLRIQQTHSSSFLSKKNKMPQVPELTKFLSATNQVPSVKVICSVAASITATGMLVRSFARDFLPRELQNYIFSKIQNLLLYFNSELTLVIEKYDGLNLNFLYNAAKLYLQPAIPSDVRRIRVTMPKKKGNISLSLDKNEEIIDNFNGVQVKWKYVSKSLRSNYIPGTDPNRHVFKSEITFFELTFHKKYREMILNIYMQHILVKAKELEEKKKTLKLFTLRYDRMTFGRGSDMWQSVNLDHPATFDTLAMDSDLKTKIIEDLKRFVERKEYYKRVGKAWKRGYLLFGPPGTGKSSLIAAMANYLSFDIYDLELTGIKRNSELRNLLISTGNKSILVVEDIDCSLEFQDRFSQAKAASSKGSHPHYQLPQNELTLSGLLNFLDGLWSSCGDERIIVFTTNHKDRLDPALLRPGRMDMHIHMSYCTACGFKLLAFNYLGMTEHPLFLEIEELLEITKVTPADVAEQLMKDEVPEIVLSGLIEFLEAKLEVQDAEATELQLGVAFQAAEDGQKVGEKQGESKE